MIQVQNLVKYYGPTLAVDHLDFTIPEGKVVGFLGPNGAGKTTTIRILTGFMPPTEGTASVAGFDVIKQPDDARRMIGYLPESTPLYTEMKVDEYLHFRGKLHGMGKADRKKRIDEVCERCGLSHNRKRVIGHLSHGNKQRVGLAQALLHNPRVLILDEPTNGFDPNQKSQVLDMIRDLGSDHTVMISTHHLYDVELIADEAIIIANGKIAARGTPTELREKVGSGGDVLVEVKGAVEAVNKAFTSVKGASDVRCTPLPGGWCRAVVSPQNGQDLRDPLSATLQSNGWQVREMRPETASLEQFFIKITTEQATQKAQQENVAHESVAAPAEKTESVSTETSDPQ